VGRGQILREAFSPVISPARSSPFLPRPVIPLCFTRTDGRTRTQAVRHSSNCIRVACAYRVGTVRYTRRGVRPNGRKTREYVRGRWVTYTWARTLCTRRAAPRRAARAALCVYRCVKAPLLRRRGARGGGGRVRGGGSGHGQK